MINFGSISEYVEYSFDFDEREQEIYRRLEEIHCNEYMREREEIAAYEAHCRFESHMQEQEMNKHNRNGANKEN